MPNTADLLEEIAALKAMLIAAEARDRRKDERIARLEKLVAAFKQAVFGRKSEKSDPDQFELALEDLETANMPSGSCRALAAFCRSMAMPDTTA